MLEFAVGTLVVAVGTFGTWIAWQYWQDSRYNRRRRQEMKEKKPEGTQPRRHGRPGTKLDASQSWGISRGQSPGQ